MYIPVHNIKEALILAITLNQRGYWEQERKFLHQNTKLPVIFI